MRKLLLFLESRASYGYSKNIISLLKKKKKFKFKIKNFVSGTHLSKELGNSFKDILKDKIKIDYSFRFNPKEKNITKSIGQLIVKTNKIINDWKPDVIIIFGDRIELMGVAIAAVYSETILAHVQAGDKSGHIDDLTRMALAKLAHIHFPATEKAKKRLIKLGEEKFRIFKVGAPQLDDIKYKSLKKNQIIKDKGKIINLKNLKYLVILQHSVYEDKNKYEDIFEKTLKAAIKTKLKIYIIYPNYDPGYKLIIKKIKQYNKLSKNIYIFKHLERGQFLKLALHSQCLIGNSSSGILESSSLKIGVVNIGNRQQGREQNRNIINSNYSEKSIYKSIKKAILIKKKISNIKNIHGDGKSSPRIINILAKINKKKFLIKKTTY
jgi:UDP-hydrolysing UDP-N-acetyl-D-glucosamine 2-epimerase